VTHSDGSFLEDLYTTIHLLASSHNFTSKLTLAVSLVFHPTFTSEITR
jgi:hypothetical protein